MNNGTAALFVSKAPLHWNYSVKATTNRLINCPRKKNAVSKRAPLILVNRASEPRLIKANNIGKRAPFNLRHKGPSSWFWPNFYPPQNALLYRPTFIPLYVCVSAINYVRRVVELCIHKTACVSRNSLDWENRNLFIPLDP